MRKIVINTCHGGFGLSDLGTLELARRKGITPRPPGEGRGRLLEGEDAWDEFCDSDTPRDDADLVAMVEEGHKQWWGRFASLAVVEIPDDVQWQIDEYDGLERVAEVHRIWGAEDRP